MELYGNLFDCPVCCDKVSSTNIINKYFSNISYEKVRDIPKQEKFSLATTEDMTYI